MNDEENVEKKKNSEKKIFSSDWLNLAQISLRGRFS